MDDLDDLIRELEGPDGAAKRLDPATAASLSLTEVAAIKFSRDTGADGR